MDTAFAATVVAVVDEGSIAGAARRLGLTAGAVALRVKALEAELGTQLIGRAGRKVGPTPAALRILGSLREIVARTTDLRHLAADGATVAGELRLGTIATASTGLLPALLATLTRTHPRLELTIEPGTSLELSERVLDGALDAAIIVEPPTVLRKGESFTPWVAEPLVLIVPPALAGADPFLLLERESFVRYDRRNWGGRIVDAWLKTGGIRVRQRIELDALDGIVAMVSAGLGVAVIPDWAGPRPEGANVATIALPPPVPVRRIGLYARSLSPRQDLIAIVATTFAASQAGGHRRLP